MIANYHTHTPRCGHARGSEREYVECALKAEMKTLGFSDHTPYDYADIDFRIPNMRMEPEELPGYAGTIRALAAEYADRIEILTGVEAEFFPGYFLRLLDLLRENGVSYLILGQHCLGDGINEPYCGKPTQDPGFLDRYVSQTTEALQTGLFSCFAHPDLIRFMGEEGEYRRQMRRLCRAARDCGVPLEINLLGFRQGRNYPDLRFWQIAAEEGSTVILGSDAHRPEDLLDAEGERKGRELAASLGIRLIEELPLRPF